MLLLLIELNGALSKTLSRGDLQHLMHDPTPLAYYAAVDLLLYVSNSSLTLHFPGLSKAHSGIDRSMRERA